MKVMLVLGFICWSLCTWSQEENFPVTLNDSLEEISGLELLGDSLFIAHNDGGDDPCLFLLEMDGSILRTVCIKETTNIDWEDLAIDDYYLYVADVGNNKNQRHSVRILKIRLDDLVKKDAVSAETIKIKYAEQYEFPPALSEMRFDSEAITVVGDSIYLFTKNRSVPTDGTTWVYSIPKDAGEYRLTHNYSIYIGKGGFWKDAITAVDYYKQEFYIMTYNRILVKKFKDGEFKGDKEIKFRKMKQREATVLKKKGEIYVGSEGQLMMGKQELDKIGNE